MLPVPTDHLSTVLCVQSVYRLLTQVYLACKAAMKNNNKLSQVR